MTSKPKTTKFRTKQNNLRNQDGFAEGAGFEDFFVGAGGVGEGKLLADDGAKGAVFEAGGDGGVN